MIDLKVSELRVKNGANHQEGQNAHDVKKQVRSGSFEIHWFLEFEVEELLPILSGER